MPLSKNQVQELLKQPRNRANIDKAVRQEKRLNFHVETSMERADASFACNEFLRWVEEQLTREKFAIFLTLFRFPISTNDLTEQILNSLEKVFDGRDPFYDYQFENQEALADWLEYKDDELGGNEAWNMRSFKTMKQAINSMIIVDMPKESTSALPEPYYYFKKIASIFDYDIDHNGNVIYVMFKKDDSILTVIDDESYRQFALLKDGEIGEELMNNVHGNGSKCPASFFWSDNLKDSNKSLKKSPLSNQLTNLDRLLKSTVDKEHLDSYAAYPIVWMYEMDCDYQTPMGSGDSGHTVACKGGFLKDDLNRYVIDKTGSVARCPVCGDNRFAGAGSVVETPFPNSEQGIPALGAPVGIIKVDKDSLEYTADKIATNSAKIYSNVVGYGGIVPNNKSINEDQVSGIFESRTSVLHVLKRNFERAQQWTESTICNIRYSKVFKRASINYGQSFYFMTAEELLSLYKQAKDSGATDAYLDSLQELIIETQHRNNPIEQQRARIIMELEPYRHMTKREVIELYKSNPSFVNADELALKLNFSNFISRFERENLPLVEFGTATSYEKKINIIKQTLNSYGKAERGYVPERSESE